MGVSGRRVARVAVGVPQATTPMRIGPDGEVAPYPTPSPALKLRTRDKFAGQRHRRGFNPALRRFRAGRRAAVEHDSGLTQSLCASGSARSAAELATLFGQIDGCGCPSKRSSCQRTPRLRRRRRNAS